MVSIKGVPNLFPSLDRLDFSLPSLREAIPNSDRVVRFLSSRVPEITPRFLSPLFQPREVPIRPNSEPGVQTAAIAFPIFIGISILVHGLGIASAIESSEEMERVGGCEAATEKLTDEAKGILMQWKEDPKIPADLGRFLLDVDLLPLCAENKEEADKTREKWRRQVEERNSPWPGACDSEARIEALVQRLYDAYFISYARDFPGLSDFLEQGEGNCVAQTKLILGALAASGIELPPHQVLGIQVFDDHLQPVIYDREKRELWVLTRGLRTKRIEGPVYHASLFYHAFLKAQGMESPVTEDDLLIREATHPKRRTPAVPELASGAMQRIFRNQGLAFPKTGIYFADGPIAERATEPRPFKHDDASTNGTPAPAMPPLGSLPKSKVNPEVLAWEDVANPRWKKYYETGAKRFTWIRVNVDSGPDEIIVFQNYRDKRQFLEVEGMENPKIAQGKILQELLSESMAEIEKSETFQQALKLSSKPHQFIRETGSGELQRLLEEIEDIQRFYDSAAGYLRGQFGLDVKASHPLWHQFLANRAALSEWAGKHPRETWLFFDQLPKEKKSIAYRWIDDKGSAGLDEYFHEHVWMSGDPSRETSDDNASDPVFGVSLDPHFWMEIDAATDPRGFPPVSPLPPKAMPAPPSQVGDIRISYETGLLLSIGNYFPPHWTRNLWRQPRRFQVWDRRISDQVLRLNRSGELDEALLWQFRGHECEYDQACFKEKYPRNAPPTHALPIFEDIWRRRPELRSPPKQANLGNPLEETPP